MRHQRAILPNDRHDKKWRRFNAEHDARNKTFFLVKQKIYSRAKDTLAGRARKQKVHLKRSSVDLGKGERVIFMSASVRGSGESF